MLFPFIVSCLGLLFLLINSILFWNSAKNKDFKFKLLAFYLVTIFVMELICHYIGFINPYSNYYLSHYVFVLQFVLLSLFFYNLFEIKIIKKIILSIFVLVVLFLIYQYASNPDLYYHFNLFEIAFTTLPLILYGLVFLFKNLKNVHPYLYFSLGLIFYLSSSATIFLSGNTEYIIFEEPFFLDIWVFNYLFYLFFQFLIFKEWQYLTGKKVYISN